MRGGFSLLVLAALVIGIAGGIAFGGGVLYGRTTAPTPRATATVARVAASPTGTPAGPGGGGRGGGGAGGGGGLQGAIDSINGNTLAVRTQQGTTTQVNLTSTTRIVTTAPASMADMKPGTIITVVGQPDDAGNISAAQITITPVDTAVPIGAGTNVGPGGQSASRGGQGAGAGPRVTPTP